MPVGTYREDARAPPPGFDAFVDWFERVSDRLVLLETYPLDDLRTWVGAVGERVRRHARPEDPLLASLCLGLPGLASRAELLIADHAWFQTSTEQLAWFLAVVEREDHGGHRQALGQYGRVYAESLRHHRDRERALGLRATEDAARRNRGPPPANSN